MLAAIAAVLLAAVGATALLALLLGRDRRQLRRLGYKRRRNGSWTRVSGAMHVEFRPPKRWVVRTGVYVAADFSAEPRTGVAPPGYAFECGNERLDQRFWFWSERPTFAKTLLADPRVAAAMLALPAKVIALRGDELSVEVRRSKHRLHKDVLTLARAIASTAPQRPL